MAANRRTFIKRASGLLAAVAAPLFIPSERLDFGVPTGRLAVPEPARLHLPAGRYFFGEPISPGDLIETQRYTKIIGGVVDLPETKRLVRVEVIGIPSGTAFKLQQSDRGGDWHDLNLGDALMPGQELRAAIVASSSESAIYSYSLGTA